VYVCVTVVYAASSSSSSSAAAAAAAAAADDDDDVAWSTVTHTTRHFSRRLAALLTASRMSLICFQVNWSHWQEHLCDVLVQTPSSPTAAAAAVMTTEADDNKTSVEKLLRPSHIKQAPLKDCVCVIMKPRSALVDLQPLYLHTRVLFTYHL